MTSALPNFSMPSFPWPFGSYVPAPAVEEPPMQALQQDPEPQDPPLSNLKLLEHYDVVSILPPSSRIDPSMKQQERQPLGLLDLWRYGLFVASKATEVAGEVLSHHVWGPRRKSWGIEMTLITTFMRNASKHTQLMDIVTLRKLIGLAGFVPLPSDALVTPVTFRVRRRKLRGMLAKLDASETGTRQLSGEWIVGKRLWKLLQSEWRSAQGKGDRAKDKPRRNQKERVVLYLHGGAYYMFSAATHRLITIQLSKHIGTRIYALDYRLAPETRFPGQLQDAAYAYFRLVEDLHIPPENILIAGDSAGGGLTLGLLMYLRDNNYPLPSGAILMSPWVDLTMSCDSWDSNAAYDVVPMPAPGDHLNPVACYLGQEGMEKYITHPYASPLFGDFKDLPPMLIQAGDSEVLRDEITLLAHKATLAGVTVRHELYEDAVHVFQTFPFLDTSRKAFLACREFVKNVLPLHQSHSPQMLDKLAETVLEREIANEKATVVRGDGLELGSGLQASRELEESSDTTDEGSKERSEDHEDPSWRRRESTFLRQPSEDESFEAPAEPTVDDQVGPSRPILHRLKSTLSIFATSPTSDTLHEQASPTPATPRSPKFSSVRSSRNHSQHMSGGSTRLSALSISSLLANPPTPTIRSRNRTISHPDISSLCEQWVNLGPANQTTKYGPNSPDPSHS